MRGWAVSGNPGGHGRLVSIERDQPAPGPFEVLVSVEVCGVCRTDLHLADGDLAPRAACESRGTKSSATWSRWARRRRGSEWETGSGSPGFAARAVCVVRVAEEERTCADPRRSRAGTPTAGMPSTPWCTRGMPTRCPPRSPAASLAPLLCSGIIGYRALKRAQLPPGGRLGIYGFGASAHLTAQLAIAQGHEVHVLTRGQSARRLALELGAASAGDAADAPPVPLDGAVLFAPAGELVPVALAALEQGGTLALAGIHLSDIPGLDYQRHLFRERTLTSVTANTRADGEEFLRLATAVGISPQVTTYGFEDADRALTDLADGALTGAAVLHVS